VITLVGHLVFTLGVTSHDFTLALVGRAIFGIGEGTILVAQGALCVQWFRTKDQLALAIGIMEMSHNLMNWLGKVSISVGLAWGGWEMTLWFGVSVCIFSCVVALIYYFLERSVERCIRLRTQQRENQAAVQGFGWGAAAHYPVLAVLLLALPCLERGAPV
jgi:MFS family permease